MELIRSARRVFSVSAAACAIDAIPTVASAAVRGHADGAGIGPQPAVQADLTASPSGNLTVATWSIGSFVDINDTKGGTSWHQVIGSGDGGAGFNDITYVSKTVAWVVGSPASMFPAYGRLLKTTDAGRHWHFVSF